MMTKQVRVSVNWLGKKAENLPAALRYSTVSKFIEDKDTWLEHAWSMLLEFDKAPVKQGNPSLGTASFLVEDAPHERLQQGTIFELYEGPTRVAEVKILEEGDL
ncbi:hypothetical protein QT397_14300 [Microbulbifer sp. MKSA007]|uniref:hypothetical protein n=1 Tax=Microbulbifer sp. VAAF005 TaxID=3034230 RepID=UPI0024AE52CC|nr:hypothetical protein [Microbulbifer sp. VAAF005]WHI47325.1 hypothetical protein P0078_02795 [Microbulbifer sp. VAAF005]WNZ58458.1 hypothetical protein QT397_14300 [Microbulbifer sp. MKSA007]